MSHTVKDDLGQVTCPVLSHYICPICSATGPVAHTIKYCPQNKDDHYHDNFASITQLKKMNSSIGKPRMGPPQMHYQEPEPYMMAGRRPMVPRGMMLGCYDYPNGGPVSNNGFQNVNNGFRRTLWHEPPSRRQMPLSSRLVDDFPSLTVSSPTGGSDGFGGGESSKDNSPLLTPPNTPWGQLPTQAMGRPLLGGMMGQNTRGAIRPPGDQAEFKWLDDLLDSNRSSAHPTNPNSGLHDADSGKKILKIENE